MAKEILTTHQAYNERISFIEKAMGEGALGKIGASERNQNIALVYCLNEEISQRELGRIFLKPSGEPLTRQGVNQINKKVLRELQKRASPRLQAAYPLCELLMRRPTALGKTASQVKSAVENGINPQDIGLSVLSIARTRRTLQRRGIKVPPFQTYANFAARVEKETSDEKLQEMLDSLSDPSIRGYVSRHREDKEKVFLSLYSVIKSAGFHPPFKHLSLFAETIKKANIPIRKPQIEILDNQMGKHTQTYWLVLTKHRQRIVERLENDPNLQKFKITPVKVNVPAYL